MMSVTRDSWHSLIISVLAACGVAACSDSEQKPTDAASRGGSAGALDGGGGTGAAAGAAGTSATGGTGGDTPTACTTGSNGVADVAWVDGPCDSAPGTTSFETAEFCVSLAPDSQTVTALKPKTEPGFDFTPADRLSTRFQPGYMHLGDVTLRWRMAGSGSWQSISTSSSRAPVTAIAASGDVKASANLAPVLPAVPLTVIRSWASEGGRLAMRIELKNESASSIEVGALGLPMIFNNVISNRSLDQAHEVCSFADPYIGRDAGYLQVTRLNGHGPALLVLPEGGTPFEAYNPIMNPPSPDRPNEPTSIFTDLTIRGQPFEGFHEWLIHSNAYADNEWSGVQPWNAPTSVTLGTGESRTYGLQFVLSDQIRTIENVLAENRRPLAVGIPGYILPMDIEAKLFLNYPAPVSSITVEPAAAIDVIENEPTANCWRAYTLQGKTWGRSRLTVTYDDGTVQTIHYTVIKPAAEVVADMGTFLTTQAWFVDSSDPFGRSPSVMTYDREDNAIVTQWHQAWVCGLGDDGGATWLAGAMKLFGQPNAEQVSKYQQFVDGPIWGGLQYSEGSLMYGVKRTLFYYEPASPPQGYSYDPSVAWTNPNGTRYWGAWDRAHTLEVPRSYNYPHVAALYWVMYRLARNNEGLVSNHSWDWYLDHAYRTSVAMTTIGDEYSRFGLMDGSVFLEILKDLKREGKTQEAADLESRMRSRADLWRTQAYPFGSEMAWDSTGQEEVYAWTKHFGYDDKAQVCLDAILGYMPTVPHWGYNGSARRFWDFKYGGAKIDRLERMLHHYGSSLNAIPVLSEYRDHPDDFYLLRIGYGGMMGSLSNIDQEGFPSMAFHSFADTMKWDARTGDYGLNFFGHAFNTATYLINHSEFGWQALGGNVSVDADTVRLTPLDSFRKRVFIAPLGLWMTLDAGKFQEVEFNAATGAVRVALAARDSHTPAARLRVEQPALLQGVGSYTVSGSFSLEREAYVVPLSSAATWVDLSD
jgi:hypothetical protein